MRSFSVRQVNIDKLDTCPETLLGLASTCCCTLFVWMFLIPLFDIVGMGWIAEWEGKHAVRYPDAYKGECVGSLMQVYATPAQAFSAMDGDTSGDVTKPEFRAFTDQLNMKLRAMGKPEMRPMPCFQEFDRAGGRNGAPITPVEFYNRAGSKYHWRNSVDAVELRKKFASIYGSMSDACKAIDTNNNSQIDLAEFRNATQMLTNPTVPTADVPRIFQHMDTSGDGAIDMSECRFQKRGYRLRLKNSFGNMTAGCAFLDADNDDKISQSEFISQSKLLTPPVHESDSKALFPRFDDDHDSFISVTPECHVDLAEFKKRVAQAGKLSFFNSSDVDQNKMLSALEFMSMAANLTPPVDHFDMEEIWQQIDVNHNGWVTAGEFWTPARLHAEFALTANVPANMSDAMLKQDFQEALSVASSQHLTVSSQAKAFAVNATTKVVAAAPAGNPQSAQHQKGSASNKTNKAKSHKASAHSKTTTNKATTTAKPQSTSASSKTTTTNKATTIGKPQSIHHQTGSVGNKANTALRAKGSTGSKPNGASTTQNARSRILSKVSSGTGPANNAPNAASGQTAAATPPPSTVTKSVKIHATLNVSDPSTISTKMGKVVNSTVTGTPEYETFKNELAKHGIILVTLGITNGPSCSGNACSYAHVTTVTVTTTSVSTTTGATTVGPSSTAKAVVSNAASKAAVVATSTTAAATTPVASTAQVTTTIPLATTAPVASTAQVTTTIPLATTAPVATTTTPPTAASAPPPTQPPMPHTSKMAANAQANAAKASTPIASTSFTTTTVTTSKTTVPASPSAVTTSTVTTSSVSTSIAPMSTVATSTVPSSTSTATISIVTTSTTSASTVTTSTVTVTQGLVQGVMLSPAQLAAYNHQPALCSGHVEVYFKTLPTSQPISWPADLRSFKNSLKPLIEVGIESELSIDITINRVDIGQLWPPRPGMPSKQANFTWQASVSDVGALMSRIQTRGLQLQEMIRNSIQGAQLGWTQQVQIDDYWVVDYHVNVQTPTGSLLRQRAGHKNGQPMSSRGEAPFTLVTAPVAAAAPIIPPSMLPSADLVVDQKTR